MAPELLEGEFVFCSVSAAQRSSLKLTPIAEFREKEGIALILSRQQAEQAGLEGSFASRMITLNVLSSLSAVGFLARITGALAAAGISVNPVSAFYHDHLFVPIDRAAEAMEVLKTLERG